MGTAPTNPFRNAVPDTSLTRRLETRASLGVSAGSEDCLSLKYVFTLIDMHHILIMIVVVSTFLAVWEKIRTFQLFSGYMGI